MVLASNFKTFIFYKLCFKKILFNKLNKNIFSIFFYKVVFIGFIAINLSYKSSKGIELEERPEQIQEIFQKALRKTEKCREALGIVLMKKKEEQIAQKEALRSLSLRAIKFKQIKEFEKKKEEKGSLQVSSELLEVERIQEELENLESSQKISQETFQEVLKIAFGEAEEFKKAVLKGFEKIKVLQIALPEAEEFKKAVFEGFQKIKVLQIALPEAEELRNESKRALISLKELKEIEKEAEERKKAEEELIIFFHYWFLPFEKQILELEREFIKAFEILKESQEAFEKILQEAEKFKEEFQIPLQKGLLLVKELEKITIQKKKEKKLIRRIKANKTIPEEEVKTNKTIPEEEVKTNEKPDSDTKIESPINAEKSTKSWIPESIKNIRLVGPIVNMIDKYIFQNIAGFFTSIFTFFSGLLGK